MISGWPAVILAPLVLPFAIIAGLLSKPVKRSPADVAGFIEDFIEGTGGNWDWDEFECVPIADPELEAIRQRAAMLGPPNPDMAGMRSILLELREKYPEIR